MWRVGVCVSGSAKECKEQRVGYVWWCYDEKKKKWCLNRKVFMWIRKWVSRRKMQGHGSARAICMVVEEVSQLQNGVESLIFVISSFFMSVCSNSKCQPHMERGPITQYRSETPCLTRFFFALLPSPTTHHSPGVEQQEVDLACFRISSSSLMSPCLVSFSLHSEVEKWDEQTPSKKEKEGPTHTLLFVIRQCARSEKARIRLRGRGRWLVENSKKKWVESSKIAAK